MWLPNTLVICIYEIADKISEKKKRDTKMCIVLILFCSYDVSVKVHS
jgi:hypothetical protein